MNSRAVRCFCFVIFLAVVLLAAGVRAAPDEGPVTDQRQAPPKEEKPKPREFGRVFCAERSTGLRNIMVGAVNCNSVCDNVYRDYPCDLQQRLSEGWKVISVSPSSIVAKVDPCECWLSGTESLLERK